MEWTSDDMVNTNTIRDGSNESITSSRETTVGVTWKSQNAQVRFGARTAGQPIGMKQARKYHEKRDVSEGYENKT